MSISKWVAMVVVVTVVYLRAFKTNKKCRDK